MAEGWGYFEDREPVWRRLREDSERERARQQGLVDLATLPAPQRRRVWEHLQRHRPALAELLRSPAVQEIRARFQAAVHAPRELIDQALRDER